MHEAHTGSWESPFDYSTQALLYVPRGAVLVRPDGYVMGRWRGLDAAPLPEDHPNVALRKFLAESGYMVTAAADAAEQAGAADRVDRALANGARRVVVVGNGIAGTTAARASADGGFASAAEGAAANDGRPRAALTTERSAMENGVWRGLFMGRSLSHRSLRSGDSVIFRARGFAA